MEPAPSQKALDRMFAADEDFLDGYPILELGYSLALSCQTPGWKQWSLRLNCGCYSPFSFNRCEMICEDTKIVDPKIFNSIDWVKLATRFVTIWQPDHGDIAINRMQIGPSFFAGWITYAARSILTKAPTFSSNIQIQPVDDLGWLFITFPADLLNPSKAEMAKVKEVQQTLKRVLKFPKNTK